MRALRFVAPLLLACCAASPPPPSETEYEACRAADTIEAYEAYLKRHARSPRAKEVTARLRTLKAQAAQTRAERTEFVLAYPDSPEAGAMEAKLVDDLVRHHEFVRLDRLREFASDPDIVAALDLSWAPEKLKQPLAVIVHGGTSLQVARAADDLGRSHDLRVARHLLDRLRHASSRNDLDRVRMARSWNIPLHETGRYRTSVRGVVESALHATTAAYAERAHAQPLLLEYRDDESEPVREYIRTYFRDLNARSQARLESEHLSKAANRDHDYLTNPWRTPGLARIATSAPQPHARAFAVLVLGVNRVQEGRAAVSAALGDDESVVRRSAVAALAALGGSSAAIRPMLDDPSAAVVATAADALGVLGDSESLGRLVALQRHADARVRFRAAGALVRLAWRPDRDAQRAEHLFALEKWEALASVPHAAVVARGLADADPYIAGACERLAGKSRAGDRTRAEIATHVSRMYLREKTGYRVAEPGGPSRWAGLGATWRSLMRTHLWTDLVRRWPAASHAVRMRRVEEVDPKRPHMVLLDRWVADRRLELTPSSGGCTLRPGRELMLLLADGSETEAFGAVERDEGLGLDPFLKRRFEFAAKSALAWSEQLTPAAVIVLTRSYLWTHIRDPNVWERYVYEEIFKRYGTKLETNSVQRVFAVPSYLFTQPAGKHQTYDYTEHFLAEATRAPLEDRYAVRLVRASARGTVRGIGEDASITIAGTESEIRQVTGLEATHLRVGDVVHVGDLLGIAKTSE